MMSPINSPPRSVGGVSLRISDSEGEWDAASVDSCSADGIDSDTGQSDGIVSEGHDALLEFANNLLPLEPGETQNKCDLDSTADTDDSEPGGSRRIVYRTPFLTNLEGALPGSENDNDHLPDLPPIHGNMSNIPQIGMSPTRASVSVDSILRRIPLLQRRADEELVAPKQTLQQGYETLMNMSHNPHYGIPEPVSYCNAALSRAICCFPSLNHGPEYDPLPGVSSIRLLIIQPHTHDRPLSCSLETINLDSPSISYEAISYKWPKSGPRCAIVLSGKKIFVSTALETMLRHLQLTDRRRCVWLDALCINQASREEREQQVGIMRRVYSQASRVIVYIGNGRLIRGSLHQGLGFREVEKLTSAWLSHLETRLTRGLKFYSGTEWYATGKRASHRFEIILSEHEMKMIRALFQHEYWTRLWIVQEIVSAERAVVQEADKQISWTLVGLAANLIRNTEPLWREFAYPAQKRAISGLMNVCLMYRLPSPQFRQGSITFLDLLHLTRNFDVTVPSDRIYAILGLPSQQTAPGSKLLRPDYSLLREGLYVRVFDWITTTHQTPLQILSAIRHTTLLWPDFPTWIPQWHIKPIRSIAGPFCHGFNATAGCGDKPLFRVTWRPRKRCLYLEGLVLGSVTSSQQVTPKTLPKSSVTRSNQKHRQHQSTIKWLQRIEKDSFAKEGSYTEEGVAMALTAGRDWYGNVIKRESDIETHTDTFRDWFLMYMLPEVRVFDRILHSVCHRRKLFAMPDGEIGLGPELVRNGDIVCVLFGGPVPYILRPLGKNTYYFVGECYVHGYMFGEAVRRWMAGPDPGTTQKFTLL